MGAEGVCCELSSRRTCLRAMPPKSAQDVLDLQDKNKKLIGEEIDNAIRRNKMVEETDVDASKVRIEAGKFKENTEELNRGCCAKYFCCCCYPKKSRDDEDYTMKARQDEGKPASRGDSK